MQASKQILSGTRRSFGVRGTGLPPSACVRQAFIKAIC